MTTGSLNLRQFLIEYFKAKHCEIDINKNNLLKIKLTEEMDKAIMNRPFYWQYIQTIGRTGEPMTLTLNTEHSNDKVNEKDVELIHFGSPRLHTIFNELHRSARFTRLFEKTVTTNNTMLLPWLVINLLIAYEGKQKKEELFSVGLQLINGTIVLNMMEHLEKISLSQQISNLCYTISPLIKLQSGYRRINNKVIHLLKNKCYKWADESIKALQEEIQLINYFYADHEKHNEEKEKEITEAINRYEPGVSIKPINGGIFYLTDSLL